MSEPREWLISRADLDCEDVICDIELAHNFPDRIFIHVVEYSAYEAVVKERDGTAALLAMQSSGASIDALIRERDAALGALNTYGAILRRVREDHDLFRDKSRLELFALSKQLAEASEEYANLVKAFSAKDARVAQLEAALRKIAGFVQFEPSNEMQEIAAEALELPEVE